jgi:hypothetical protein
MLAAGRSEVVIETEPTIALGAAPSGKPNDYRLAISVQRPDLMGSAELERVIDAAAGEVEVAFVGPGFKQSGNTGRTRPLEIGCSIGHPRITAGTLGCFVETPAGLCVLSNNHVLADEDRAKPGEEIIQPGRSDGGGLPADAIGTLAHVVPLTVGPGNRMDAATLAIADGIDIEPGVVPGLGSLAGVSDATGQDPLAKVGRTSGLTRGRIFAIDVDGLSIGYEKGMVVFDGVIQVLGTGGLFTRAGDSGSLVVTDESNPHAVGLHFAGLSNGHAVCAPLPGVLEELQATLVR